MSGSNLLQKGKEILSSVSTHEKTVDTPKELDVKLVFQDTKKSLESLKLHIFSDTDIEKRKERDQHILQYIDRLLGFSVLEQKDKELLTTIKSNLSSLKESDIETIITIVSHLEQKAETLSEVDKEKVKELNQTLVKHKASLDLLKQGVASVVPTIEDAKKKAFETLKKDLEGHRWSSRLAQPVYDYLMDKHIHKKSVSKFMDWLMGTVGLTVVGWFVGKELKTLIANIDTLSVEDIVNNPVVSNVVDTVEDFTDENINLAKSRFEGLLQKFVKKNTGKDLTKEQMDRVMQKLNVGEAFKDSSSEMMDVYKYLMNNDSSAADANIAVAGVEMISFPLTFSVKIFQVLKEESIIGYEDIGITMVNGMVEYGLKGFQLFGTGLGWVMGRIPLDQLSAKMSTIYDRHSETADYLMYALMYRSTNSFLFQAISNTTAYVAKMALWPLVESGDDINTLKIIQDGYKSNIDETLKHLKRIQQVLPSAGADLIGQYSKGFEDTIRILEESNNVSKILSSLQDGPNLIDDLKRAYRAQYGIDLPDSLLKEIVDDSGNTILSKKSDIFKHAIAKNVRGAVSGLKSSISNKSLLDKAKLVFGKSPIQSLQKMQIMEDVTNRLDDVSTYFGNVVSHKGSIFQKGILGGAKSRINMVKAGMNLAEDADRMVFAFDSIDDMKKFIDYSKAVAKTTPEALKFLIGKSPIFLISGMAIAKDGDMAHKMEELGKGLLGLVPLVGPIILIGDSMKVSDINWTQAGIGSALLVTDTIYGIKAVNKIGFTKALVRGLSKPIIDVAEIIRAGYTSGSVVMKRGKGMFTVLQSEGLVGFGKTFMTEILSLGRLAKLGTVAALIYGGYCTVDYILDSIDDKEVHDMVQKYKDDPKGLNIYLQEQWPHYDQSTRASILAYSAGAQLGISGEKMSDIDVEYDKESAKYTINLPVVYSRDYLIPLKNTLESTLHIVEPSACVEFVITGSAQVDYEKMLEEQGYSENEIKKQYSALGYSKK